VNEAQLGCAHALTVHHIPFFARQIPHELENTWKCDIPQAFCMLSENLVNSQPYPWALLALCLSQVEVGPHLNQCLCRCRIACSHSCGANSCDRSSSCLLLSQLLLLQHGRHRYKAVGAGRAALKGPLPRCFWHLLHLRRLSAADAAHDYKDYAHGQGTSKETGNQEVLRLGVGPQSHHLFHQQCLQRSEKWS